MTQPSANSSSGFSKAIVTLVPPVVTSDVWVRRVVCVWVMALLLVEKMADVTVIPTIEMNVVVELTVEVLALTTAAVLVAVVLIVEVMTTVCEVVIVVSANVTWNMTGKLGIVKLQTYPASEAQMTPFVKW